MSRGPFGFAVLISLVATSGALGADPVVAPDQPLAIVGILDSSNSEQGDALTAALKRTLDASTEWKNLELDSPISHWISTGKCPDVPDPACLSRIARNAGVTRFIWGMLKQKQGRVIAQLWLYQGESSGTNAQLEYSARMIDTFDENLLRIANNGLTQLLGPIHFPVLVRSRESSGTLVIDDVVVGSLERGTAMIAAGAGDHRFRLVLPDATVIARNFQVRVQSANHLRLDFINVPES